MSAPVIAACLWVVTATLIAMLPSKDYHWRAAYVLIAVGIPIVGWVTLQNGPLVALLVIAAGVSVLRWPALYFWRWVRRGVAPKT